MLSQLGEFTVLDDGVSVTSPMEIRELSSEEWRVLRDVKIRALQESPDVFEEDLTEILAWDCARWLRHISPSDGELKRIFVAKLDRGYEGIVCVADDKLSSGTGYIGSMWVTPNARGGGIGRGLLDAALSQIHQWGLRRARLCVAEGDTAAISLYQSVGFTETGVRKPLPSQPSITVIEMHRQLPNAPEQ